MRLTVPLFLLVLLYNVCAVPLLWPEPLESSFGNERVYINPDTLKTEVPSNYIINKAFERYYDLFFPLSGIKNPTNDASANELVQLIIVVSNEEESLDIGTDESYELSVSNRNGMPGYLATISADNCFGILRGFETLSQLIQTVPHPNDGTQFSYQIENVPIHISDRPRFPWRGLMVDTARHYSSVEQLKKIIDGMAYTKLNVLHWHITDAQSFPFESRTFPKLVEGAYRPTEIYTYKDIEHIRDYAYLRGIIVVPEIDAPGHVYSWRTGYPDVVLPCIFGDANSGILNIAKTETYDIVQGIYSELISLFPSYIHVGADEMHFDCLTLNDTYVASSEDFWSAQNISHRNIQAMASYYFSHTLPVIQQHFRGIVAWEEFQLGGFASSFPDIVIQAWRSWGPSGFRTALESGHKTLLSTRWYLDEEPHSNRTWKHFYTVNDLELDFARSYSHLALGGESCLWAELVNEEDREFFIWPNAAVIAERLWSNSSHIDTAEDRLDAWICRSQRRGIQSSQVRPGYCFTVKDFLEVESSYYGAESSDKVQDSMNFHVPVVEHESERFHVNFGPKDSSSSLIFININYVAVSCIVAGVIIGLLVKIAFEKIKFRRNIARY